ncbi:hypothetical protein JAAARDRAFT_41687 [Jaapia argillacea MUCL 33604]|uniref:Serine aminopeptidase S33 domain-containing protein n=1 Tax=Jaapia argillacea MUCL 33604 TaxID=933084 RepID=A0A067PAQ5_9AGAM|nr:hypothetical protein JAAARDRAFT_41687 [Jaapia argillacea MUCL 33604]
MSKSSTYTENWVAGPQRTQFYTRLYPSLPISSPPKALIVFIHGFIDHVGRYEAYHALLAGSGYTVFTYDQRGFGRTALDKAYNKGKNGVGAYAKTSWNEQFQDMEWAILYARQLYPGLPTYLMGQSMGGGLVLGFPTRPSPPPSDSIVQSLAGVIATSPLLLQTTPVPSLVVWAGSKVALVVPYLQFPAEVSAKDLCHDPEVVAEAEADPLLKHIGCLKGTTDMFIGGSSVLHTDYKNWPQDLPILMIHGTADKVTSPKASESFYAKLDAADKKLTLYPGAYHETMHEPEGIKEEVINEIVAWLDAHADSGLVREGHIVLR